MPRSERWTQPKPSASLAKRNHTRLYFPDNKCPLTHCAKLPRNSAGRVRVYLVFVQRLIAWSCRLVVYATGLTCLTWLVAYHWTFPILNSICFTLVELSVGRKYMNRVLLVCKFNINFMFCSHRSSTNIFLAPCCANSVDLASRCLRMQIMVTRTNNQWTLW